MKRLSKIFAVLLICFCSIGAQNNPDFTESLSWIPLLEFSSMHHYHIGNIEKEKIDDNLAINLEGSFRLARFQCAQFLPLTLRDHWIYKTRVIRPKFKYVIADEYEIEKRKNSGDHIRHATGNLSKPFFVDSFSNEYIVFGFDNLDELVATALTNGEISTTRKKVFKKPIYFFKSKAEYGNSTPLKASHELYGYVTTTGLFLVSKSEDDIRRMVASGMGRELSILDSPEFSDLKELANDLRFNVNFYKTNRLIEARTNALKDIGLEDSVEEILADAKDEGKQADILTFTYSREHLEECYKSVYMDEEYAERELRKAKLIEDPNKRALGNSYDALSIYDLKRKKTKLSISGNIITRIIKKDEEYWKAYHKLLNGIKQLHDEKEKTKEKEEKQR